MRQVRYFLFSPHGQLLRELATQAEIEAADGGEDSIVQACGDDVLGWTLEAEQYYFRDGHLSLAVTQPLARALALYGALLAVDADIERVG